MAWRCSGGSYKELIDNLVAGGIIRSKEVENGMRQVDRKFYCRSGSSAYSDSPQTIGYGATISAPHMHAYCLEFLKDNLKPGMSALDVGSGSGYLVAVMAKMVGETGKVFGIEHIDELVDWSISNVKAGNPELLQNGNVQIKQGDGRTLKGFEHLGPFDAIHVGAAADGIPQILLDKLAPGGVLISPEGRMFQELVQFKKHQDGTLEKQALMGVRYVPLTDAASQRA